MTALSSSYSDIGNQITELNKVVFRVHGDLKVVQQILMDDVQGAKDPSKAVSSVLGKYIIGAKNNFRGFSGKQDDNNTPLKVTVHHRGEEADREGQSDAAGESECERRGSDCDVVKMEEGRVKSKLGVCETNTGNDEKEEVRAAAGSAQAEGESEPVAEGANWVGPIPLGQTGGKKWTEKSSEQAGSTHKSTDVQSTITRIKDIELQESKPQGQWGKSGNLEPNLTSKSGVGESERSPASVKSIPTPTGSSSSQDTGFGSQEGEGHNHGVRVNP